MNTSKLDGRHGWDYGKIPALLTVLKQAVDISLLCNKVRENTRKGMMIGRVMLKRLQSRWEKRMTKVQRLMRQ